MSMAVPGVIGATTVTSRLGNCSWAWTDWACVRADPNRQAAASAVTTSLESIMASSLPFGASSSSVIARESGRSSNPGAAAEYWVPAFAGTTASCLIPHERNQL